MAGRAKPARRYSKDADLDGNGAVDFEEFVKLMMDLGEAVQVDPVKPTLKPPGAERLKVKCGCTAFNFCFQIQLALLHHGRRPGPRRH